MYSKKSNKPKKYVAGGILLAQLGLEAGKGLYGAYQAEQASRELAKLKTPATSVSEYQELYKQSIDSDIQRRKEEQLAQQMATSLQALQGVRGGAQVPALTRMYGELGLREAEAAQARQMAALGQLAGAEERALERDIMQYERRRGELGAALEGGIQNIAGAVGGGAQALGTYAGAEQTQKLIEALTKKDQAIPELKEGGMMTNGAFNHKSNPIDIIQKGNKIGEMTGGEVILNPKQQQAVASQSPYFRQLLKKFNKQK